VGIVANQRPFLFEGVTLLQLGEDKEATELGSQPARQISPSRVGWPEGVSRRNFYWIGGSSGNLIGRCGVV
jgi:hypothetical protein